MTGEEIKEQVYDAVACDDMFYRPELRDAIYDMVGENEKLKLENAKLRELVRDIFEEIEVNGFDPYVERQGKRGPYYEEDLSWRVGIRERVRELGIEAGE